jgi:hypothetical protein
MKRKRAVESHALVVAFDEPEKPVEVDLRVLEPFGCALHKVLTRDAPAVEVGGRPAWVTKHMTRAVLLSFLRSLYYGVFTLGKGVSYAELAQAFDYENVSLGSRELVRPAPSGPLRERAEPVASEVHDPFPTVSARFCTRV